MGYAKHKLRLKTNTYDSLPAVFSGSKQTFKAYHPPMSAQPGQHVLKTFHRVINDDGVHLLAQVFSNIPLFRKINRHLPHSADQSPATTALPSSGSC